MSLQWNFADVWETVAQCVPGRMAQVHGTRRIAWSEFDARANGIARTLLQAGGMTLGVGAGQMSRIDSARIASIKAQNAGLTLAGSAVASDAFFPFRDGLDVVVDAGAACVIQPGGSMRDAEVIAAADERGIAMVLTGVRHFRH